MFNVSNALPCIAIIMATSFSLMKKTVVIDVKSIYLKTRSHY